MLNCKKDIILFCTRTLLGLILFAQLTFAQTSLLFDADDEMVQLDPSSYPDVTDNFTVQLNSYKFISIIIVYKYLMITVIIECLILD